MSTDETPKKLQDIRDELRIQRELDARQFATQTENTKKYTEELRTMRKDMGDLPEGVEELLNKMLKFDAAVEKEVQKRYDQDKREKRRGKESDREWQKQFLKSMGMIKKGIKAGQGSGVLPKTATTIGMGALAALVGTLSMVGGASTGVPKVLKGNAPVTTQAVQNALNAAKDKTLKGAKHITAPVAKVVDPTVELLKKQREAANAWLEDRIKTAGKFGQGMKETFRHLIPESFGRQRGPTQLPKFLEIMKTIKEFLAKGWGKATEFSQFLKGLDEMARGTGKFAQGSRLLVQGGAKSGWAAGKGLGRALPVVGGGLAVYDAMDVYNAGPGGLQGGGEAAGILAESYLDFTTMGLMGGSNLGQNVNMIGSQTGQVLGDMWSGSLLDAALGASQLPAHGTKAFEDIADSGFGMGVETLYGDEGLIFGLINSPFQNKDTAEMGRRLIDIDVAGHHADFMDGMMMAGEGLGREMVEAVLEEPWYRQIMNGMFNAIWTSSGGSGRLNIVPPASAGKLDVNLGGGDMMFGGMNLMSGAIMDPGIELWDALQGPGGGRRWSQEKGRRERARLEAWSRKIGRARNVPLRGDPMPGLAIGGIVKGLGDGIGGLFRLGEKGDEMVAPLKSLADEVIKPIMSEAQGLVSEGSRNLPALINPIMSKGMNMAREFMENDQIKDLTASMPAMLDKIAGMVPNNIAIAGPTITTSNTTMSGGSRTVVRNPDFSRQIDMNC